MYFSNVLLQGLTKNTEVNGYHPHSLPQILTLTGGHCVKDSKPSIERQVLPSESQKVDLIETSSIMVVFQSLGTVAGS